MPHSSPSPPPPSPARSLKFALESKSNRGKFLLEKYNNEKAESDDSADLNQNKVADTQ